MQISKVKIDEESNFRYNSEFFLLFLAKAMNNARVRKGKNDIFSLCALMNFLLKLNSILVKLRIYFPLRESKSGIKQNSFIDLNFNNNKTVNQNCST
jgi:hypothetical protein